MKCNSTKCKTPKLIDISIADLTEDQRYRLVDIIKQYINRVRLINAMRNQLMDKQINKVEKDVKKGKTVKAKKDIKILKKMDKKMDAKVAKCDAKKPKGKNHIVGMHEKVSKTKGKIVPMKKVATMAKKKGMLKSKGRK